MKFKLSDQLIAIKFDDDSAPLNGGVAVCSHGTYKWRRYPVNKFKQHPGHCSVVLGDSRGIAIRGNYMNLKVNHYTGGDTNGKITFWGA